jgi:uncharacterized membrane protein
VRLAGGGLLLLAAVAVALVSLRYLLPGMPAAAPLDNVGVRPSWLALHAGAGATALVAGALQLVLPRRGRALVWHRRLGRLYIAAVAAAALAGLVLAPTTTTGAVAAWGFGTLAVLWPLATGLAWRAVRAGEVAAHRRWMLRSYAMTAAAVTLRVQLPLTGLVGLPFEIAYPAIAWACWVPNLIAVELWLRQSAGARPRPAAATAAAQGSRRARRSSAQSDSISSTARWPS